MRSRFSRSRRARTSTVSSTSCFTAVLSVARLDAMKSASRPGSVMFIASTCKSSDSRGDRDTTCWKLVLMFRCRASTTLEPILPRVARPRWPRCAPAGRAGPPSRFRGWNRDSPCTMSRARLPSGSLNILWMCVAVPTRCKSSCVGSSIDASRWVNTPTSLLPLIASSMRRTELSRATASGRNELGNNTVSRSGRIGSSLGIATGCSADASPMSRRSSSRLMTPPVVTAV